MIFIPRLGIIAAGYTTVFTYFYFLFFIIISLKITNKQLFDTKNMYHNNFCINFSLILHILINQMLIRYVLTSLLIISLVIYF